MPGEGQGLCALAEQRGQRAPARLNRVCSVLTQVVEYGVGKAPNVHEKLPAATSGRLPFLGLSAVPGHPATNVGHVIVGRDQV